MSNDIRIQNGANVVRLPLLGRPVKSKADPPHAGAVVVRGRFSPASNGQARGDDVVEVLEQLLSQARKGRICGIAWAVSLPEGLLPTGERMAADTAGEAAQDPRLGSELGRVLDWVATEALKKAEAMLRGDPVEH